MFAQDDLFPPPQETVSMAETIYSASTPAESVCDVKEEDEEKKPKKRKSWGQELPVPKTNLPPRKRAKTEDEKEQRRIERVLRNRQAAQSSRERKRQEVEKLEGEKSAIETQNDMLKERLMAVEHEKFKLEQQLSQLTAENAALRSGSSPPRASLTPPSDFAADLLDNQKAIKQEIEDSLFALRTPISLPSDSFSPSPSASTDSRSPSPTSLDLGFHALTTSPDMTQHPAAMLCDLQCQSRAARSAAMTRPTIRDKAPSPPSLSPTPNPSTLASHGLFAAPPSPPSHLSFFEEGLASTGQPDDPSNVFTFDSMVDLDACGSNGILDGDNNDCTFGGDHDFFQNNDSLPADISHQTPPASPALQPCLGAPSSGRDGSGNAS
ncbi:MAG: hypothetical protein LQ348_000081 [Seirophora lacunosa]|nr:MAG: hypothetical protein LQ344_002750 [Seirophora lacunosa]KAI4208604.1 MAG: hypothetical protein LQ348_000081 [Seirophora lacunosa]